MTSSIFCPSSHLILDAPRCEQCGWTRPLPGELGELAWGPIELDAGLGGPGRSVFAKPATAQGVAVFPLRDGELVGLDLNDGAQRWRFALQDGLMTRSLAADCAYPREGGERLLLSLSDERMLEQAGQGQLAALEPGSGQLTTLWQPDAHQLSTPTVTEDLILLRTSASELVALHQQAKPEVAWRQGLTAWWALPPTVVGNQTSSEMVLVPDGRAMHGEGQLRAFSLADGRERWQIPTKGLLTHAPVLVGGVLVVRTGRKQIMGLEANTGKTLWEQEHKRIYSGLAAGPEYVYLVVRGAAGTGETGHYMLQALNPETGEAAWETPLPVDARMRVINLLEDNALLLGGDDGSIMAYDAAGGGQLWAFVLGSEEDPIHTELVVVDGYLLVGTYSGVVAALQVGQAPGEPGDPQTYLDQCDYQRAADAYALRGDLQRAAEIYAQNLEEIEKSLALYEHAGAYAEAGELARAHQMHDRALMYYEKTGDLLKQAETHLERGDDLEAAKLYEQAGEYLKAADLYEQSGQRRKALKLHVKRGELLDVVRLSGLVLLKRSDTDVVEYLEREEHLVEAAEIAVKIGWLEKAAKLYRDAEEGKSELEVLISLTDRLPEEWSLQRLAELSRSMGQFQREAQAWEKLGRSQHTAEAFQRAARQAEQVMPEDEDGVASLYTKAGEYYTEAGLEPEALRCRDKWVYYRRLPKIEIEAQVSATFWEEKFNDVELVIRNTGRGRAHQILVQLGKDRFEVDDSTGELSIERLASGAARLVKVYVRPEERQIGDKVPLLLIWSWSDRHGNLYEDSFIIPVTVRNRDDSRPTGPPITYILEKGNVIQADTVIDGDQVAGDKIDGDKLEPGAQKGDKIEIRRGEGVHQQAEGLSPAEEPPEEPTIQCPNCHLPVSPDDNFCQECRYDLTNEN